MLATGRSIFADPNGGDRFYLIKGPVLLDGQIYVGNYASGSLDVWVLDNEARRIAVGADVACNVVDMLPTNEAKAIVLVVEDGSLGADVVGNRVTGGFYAGGISVDGGSSPVFAAHPEQPRRGRDARRHRPLGALRRRRARRPDREQYGPRPNSPVVDAGASDALPPTVTTDLAGAARVLGTVDIGAYEVPEPGAPEAFEVAALALLAARRRAAQGAGAVRRTASSSAP